MSILWAKPLKMNPRPNTWASPPSWLHQRSEGNWTNVNVMGGGVIRSQRKANRSCISVRTFCTCRLFTSARRSSISVSLWELWDIICWDIRSMQVLVLRWDFPFVCVLRLHQLSEILIVKCIEGKITPSITVFLIEQLQTDHTSNEEGGDDNTKMA